MKKIKLIVMGITMTGTMGLCVTFLVWGHSRVAAATVAAQEEQVIHITARKFSYSPPQLVLKKGESVILELTSQDREHGFRLTELGIRAIVKPGEITRVRLMPQKTGRFAFECNVFCGSGHEEMAGEIVVVD